jgi:hypothetical protein
VLLYMHEKLETLIYITSKIHVHVTKFVSNYRALKTIKLRLPYCIGLRINPLETSWHHIPQDITKDFKLLTIEGCQHCLLVIVIVTLVSICWYVDVVTEMNHEILNCQ